MRSRISEFSFVLLAFMMPAFMISEYYGFSRVKSYIMEFVHSYLHDVMSRKREKERARERISFRIAFELALVLRTKP